VRDWEQGRRQPEQAARVLLLVIDHNPKAVFAALENVVQRSNSRQPVEAAAQ
jgi:hypothetical protein